jgi:hypothetical protein
LLGKYYGFLFNQRKGEESLEQNGEQFGKGDNEMDRTPDEIMKALRIHSLNHPNGCVGCAYRDPNKISFKCQSKLFKDVREYIKQLEADKAELLKKVEQLKAQRDAACLKNRSIETMHMCYDGIQKEE